MRFCILMGSPRLQGNTAELLKPFLDELEQAGAHSTYITIADKKISPCISCYDCQQVTGIYGCRLQDDMQDIVDAVRKSDCFILATPIYIWYCPAGMKAMLERFYGMNKYYGQGSGSLWTNKHCAIIATHGYDAEHAAGPFIEGIKHFCRHAGLRFSGIYSVRDDNDLASFQTEQAVFGARQFARQLLQTLETS